MYSVRRKKTCLKKIIPARAIKRERLFLRKETNPQG
jgi:hypothetical protein